MKVSLRKKPISGGRESLYLDIYRGNGIRNKEFLGLYLTGEKKGDRETLRIAEQVRVKRQAGFDAGRLGLTVHSPVTLGEFIRKMAAERDKESTGHYSMALHHVARAGIDRAQLSALSVADCERFKRYLLRLIDREELLSGSASSYMRAFRTVLRQAYKGGDIAEPLHDRFDGIRCTYRLREFLSIEEARALMVTPYGEPYRSFILFALLTGLRSGELTALKWEHLDGCSLRYYQAKTRKWGRRKISEQAVALIEVMQGNVEMPGTKHLTEGSQAKLEKRIADGFIWPWVPDSAHMNRHLRRWVGMAGINRHLTIHCLRHTFATLQLSAGTRIEVVSGLLSHTDIRTTQIYARILDSAIDDAADKVIL